MPYKEGSDRNQIQAFPETLEDYVSEDNSVRVIDAFVDTINVKEMGFTKSVVKETGAPPYNPKDMLKLFLYGYNNGIRSSRKLENETYRNIEVIWLIGRLHPDFKTIADFRKENKKPIKEVFKQFNLFCKEWDLFGCDFIAVDGTKFRADNSKKNNYNKKKLERNLKHIEENIEKYLKEMDENDAGEKEGLKLSAGEIKEKIKGLEDRKSKYHEMLEVIETSGSNEISTTDEDARMMDNKKNGLEVSYNVQIAVDDKHKLILANEVTNKPSDQGHLNEMVQASKKTLGLGEKDKLEVAADKGYYQADDLIACDENGTVTYITHQVHSNGTGVREYYPDKFTYDKEEDVYICPEGQKLNRVKHKKETPEYIQYKNPKACANCPNREKCTACKKGRTITRGQHQDFLDVVDARTMANMGKYKKRQMIVEHPFGTVKRTMNAGFFLTRGLASVSTEADLTFLVYNIKRVINIIGTTELVRRLKAKKAFLFCGFLRFC